MGTSRPLDGIRVLELGQLLAGPFAGTILGYFGAEVIKVEPPGAGDPIRNWRLLDGGTSLWWRSLGRNKKCLSIDLRLPEGRDLVRKLAAKVDVVIENFKPGTLEKWGLGPDDLKADNPGLIFARVSGYGQTGPKSHLPGYASVCEGVGGLRYVNGVKGESADAAQPLLGRHPRRHPYRAGHLPRLDRQAARRAEAAVRWSTFRSSSRSSTASRRWCRNTTASARCASRRAPPSPGWFLRIPTPPPTAPS